ncbi:MAG: hypothetical protein R2777_08130 [Chitinophagales bacterium]
MTAERLVLNFMQRMSGIATLTKKYVDEVEGTGVKVLDTRKTTPNLRYFEKWAVKNWRSLQSSFWFVRYDNDKRQSH